MVSVEHDQTAVTIVLHLAVAIEPAEPTTSKTIAEVGASETLRLISSTGPTPGVDKVAGELWRDLATPRLTPKTVQSRCAQETTVPVQSASVSTAYAELKQVQASYRENRTER